MHQCTDNASDLGRGKYFGWMAMSGCHYIFYFLPNEAGGAYEMASAHPKPGSLQTNPNLDMDDIVTLVPTKPS